MAFVHQGGWLEYNAIQDLLQKHPPLGSYAKPARGCTGSNNMAWALSESGRGLLKQVQ